MKLKAKTSSSPYLALDIGDRYIGIAFSEAGILVSTDQTIDRKEKSDEQIFSQIAEIIRSKEIKTLVVGLPINADGSENFACQKIRDFILLLDAHIGASLPIIFPPEDYSSIDAHLLPKPKLNQKQKTSSHSQAAKIILERFLEAQS